MDAALSKKKKATQKAMEHQEGTGGNNRLAQNSPFVPADLSGAWPAGRDWSLAAEPICDARGREWK